MFITKLSVIYYCKACKQTFKSIIGGLSINFKDMPDKLRMKECLSCHKQDDLKVIYIEFEEKKANQYRCTIECGICGAKWSREVSVKEGQYFSDVEDYVLLSSICPTKWCGDCRVMPYEDFSKHRKVIMYQKL